MSTPSEAQAQVTIWPMRGDFWRARVVQGSAILLVSTAVVAATNLLYNILIARILGASGFGHASALYTLLMLVTAITLSFQIVTSKFIARNPDPFVRVQIYSSLLRKSWLVGLAVALLLTTASAYLKSYLNLPAQRDLLLLAIAGAVYIPLGVQRGRMQGCYKFSSLALNVVVEVAVKFFGALIFLYFGLGVSGVVTAITLSIIAAYLVGEPGSGYHTKEKIKIAPFGEGMQAVLYFIGQVILSNLDILLVKHFFPPAEAGIYAAVALVGRVVFMLSWSVVSSMFPIAASQTHPQGGRSVLYSALLLVGGLTSTFIVAVALTPEAIWAMLLGRQFMLGTAQPFSKLLTEYAVMTGVYSIAVVIMMYEISRRIGTAAWVQFCASAALTGAIWFYHDSLFQVILVQMFVMGGLLAAVAIPLFGEQAEEAVSPVSGAHFSLWRLVPEEEIIAEFLRGEFHHPEYDSYREDFKHLVQHPDLAQPDEAVIRRALLFLRRGRLWRELPADTQWWEIKLTREDVGRLQSFPRNEWKRFAGGGFSLTEMVGRIEAKIASGEQSQLIKKVQEIAVDLRSNHVPDAVLLIGTDACQPLTIIEGNHRMAAAVLTTPESVHQRFRFYCGLSPKMNSCCWHKTDLRSVTRYLGHTIRYVFADADFVIARTLREKFAEIEIP